MLAVKQYEVEMQQKDVGEPIFRTTANSETSTATFSNLKPNTEYCFRVRGTNEGKKGEWSKPCEIQSTSGPPCQPPKPEVEIIAPKEATIQVPMLKNEDENGSPVTHVIIETCTSNTDAQWSSKLCKVHANKAPINQVVKLDNSVQYYFRVRMKNEAGDSNPSEIVKAPYLIPGPPQNIHKQENLWVREMSHNRITVTWDKPVDQPLAVKQYEVEMQQKDVGEPIFRTTANSETSTATFSNLKPNTEYCFRVRGTNERKKGEWSKPCDIQSASGPPCQPPKPALCIHSTKRATLTVQCPNTNGSPVTEVIVEKSNKGANDWTKSCTFKAEGNFFNNEGKCNVDVALRDDIHHFRVKMRNGVGDSDPSPVVDVPPAVFPGKLQNLNCKHKNSCYQVTISWEQPTTNPEAATRYELQRQEDENGQ